MVFEWEGCSFTNILYLRIQVLQRGTVLPHLRWPVLFIATSSCLPLNFLGACFELEVEKSRDVFISTEGFNGFVVIVGLSQRFRDQLGSEDLAY